MLQISDNSIRSVLSLKGALRIVCMNGINRKDIEPLSLNVSSYVRKDCHVLLYQWYAQLLFLLIKSEEDASLETAEGHQQKGNSLNYQMGNLL